jgi:hypothetical protein
MVERGRVVIRMTDVLIGDHAFPPNGEAVSPGL